MGQQWVKRLFLWPAVLLLLSLVIFPLLWSLGISFTNIQRGASRQTTTVTEEGEEQTVEDRGFLGMGFDLTLRNYGRMRGDQRLGAAAGNTLFFVVAGVILQYALGLGLALLLNQKFVGRNIFRVVFLMPMMMTPVAAAYTGRMMFNASISPLAEFQQALSSMTGLDISIPWFTSATWAPITIVIIETWQWTPFMLLLLLAGMQAIPDDLYEAARVDGANAWQIFSRITFPILLPISTTVILIRALEIFKIIDIIVVTTGGGPGSATESLTMYIFDTALSFGNYGYAAAISYVLLVLVVIFSTLFLLFMNFVTPRTET